MHLRLSKTYKSPKKRLPKKLHTAGHSIPPLPWWGGVKSSKLNPKHSMGYGCKQHWLIISLSRKMKHTKKVQKYQFS